MSNRSLTKIFAFIAIFNWGAAFVSTKMLMQTGILTPIEVGILRYFLASVLLLILAFVQKMKRPALKDIPILCS